MAEPGAKPDVAPQPEDPNAKRPLTRPSDKGILPTPMDAPGKLNQLDRPWGPNPLAPASNRPGNGDPATSPSAQAWPPVNILRNDEIPASFHWPDRSPAPQRSAPVHSALDSSFPPLSPQAERRLNPIKLADWQVEGSRSAGPALPIAAKNDRPSAPTISAAPGRPTLHWVDPLAPNVSGKAGEQLPGAIPRSVSPSHDDTARRGPTGRSPGEGPEARPAAPLARVPFVPSNSLREPLAPVDPRALTDHGTPLGATPPDAASNRLAPPNKINEISAPMFRDVAAKVQPQPATKTDQNNVTGIDPLAIGKSLDPSRLPADFAPKDPLKSAADIGPKAHGSASKEAPPLADGFVSSRPAFAESHIGPSGRTLSPWNSPSLVQHNETNLPNRPLSAGPAWPGTKGPDTVAPLDVQAGGRASPPLGRGFDSNPPYGSAQAGNALNRADYQFYQFAEPAMPTKLAGINPLVSSKPLPSLTPPQNPVALPQVNKAQTAALIVSDGGTDFDRVQRTTYRSPEPAPQQSGGRGNPLRSSAASGGEALSTDGPAGWTNPLR
jgi:hypothetical protein